MNFILKKGVSLEEIFDQIKASNPPQKKHDFAKYVGKIKFKKDPLTIQKQMRDEWE
jgi:hypothetical protein